MSLGILLALRVTGADPLAGFGIVRGSVARWSYPLLTMGLVLVLAVLLRGAGPWRVVLARGPAIAASIVGAVAVPLLVAWVWSASAGGTSADIGVTASPVLFAYLCAALLAGVVLCVAGLTGMGRDGCFLGYGSLALYPLAAAVYVGLRLVSGPGTTPIIGGLVVAVLATVTTGACALTVGPGRVLFSIVFVCGWSVLGRMAMG